MRTIALLSFLSLWTEMAAVHAGETETSCGQLITVAAISTGSELTATGFSCEPDAPPISSRFMSAVGLVSLPECGSHFRGTSGSVASCGAGSRSAANITDRCGSSAQPLSVHPVSLN